MQIFFSFRRNNNNRLDDVLSEKGVGFGYARIRHDQDAGERRDSSCRIDGLAGEFGFVVRLHADVSDRQRVMAVAFDWAQLVARLFDSVQFGPVAVPLHFGHRLARHLAEQLDIRVFQRFDLRVQLAVEERQTGPADSFDGRGRH